jgi:transposase
VYANRRRTRGERSKELQRTRSELTERSMAHMYETGGMRRVHLKGRNNILKRLLVHAGGFNLALIMRKLVGVGKPRRLQGLSLQLLMLLARLFSWLRVASRRSWQERHHFALQSRNKSPASPSGSGIYRVTYLQLAA